MPVTKTPFGTTTQGEQVSLYRLENKSGAYVELLDYGCAIHAIVVPDASGRLTDVALGYDTVAPYEGDGAYIGVVVGRFANRIGKGELVIDGKAYTLAVNNGPNHLHGGLRGFNDYIWDAATDARGVTFSRVSPDGEEGYPGTLTVAVRYEWSEDNALSIRYTATTDATTAINLTNHCYFNLNGGGTVLGHRLTVAADEITENDENCLPTGAFVRLDDCAVMDFRMPKTIGQDIDADDMNIQNGSGYDHNYVLRAPGLVHVAARLVGERSGIELECRTTQPGIQVYSANFLTARTGKGGAVYVPRDAVCLETQRFPDGIAKGFTPAPLLAPGAQYDETTVYAFRVV